MRLPPFASSLLALSALASGCSSSDAPAGSPGSGGAGSADAAVDAPVCNAAAECRTASEGAPPPTGGVCLKTLDTSVVDVDGKPVADVVTAACGSNICLQQRSAADGTVHIDICQYIVKPAYKIIGGTKWVSFAVATPAGQEVLTYPPTTAFALPAAGAPLKAGTDAVSGDATLAVADGATIVVDKLNFSKPIDQQFRAVSIPVAKSAPWLDTSLGLELLWALGPLDTTFDPPARLTVPNTAGWPAGQLLEVFMQGIDLAETYAPYGAWAQIGTATVSADGATISTDDAAGSGVPQLTIAGFRKKK